MSRILEFIDLKIEELDQKIHKLNQECINKDLEILNIKLEIREKEKQYQDLLEEVRIKNCLKK